MSRLLLPVAFTVSLAVMLSVPSPPVVAAAAPGKPDEELVDRVRDAMEKGVRFLKKQQAREGHWENIVLDFMAQMKGGTTALVTLALLNCGLKPDDPAVAKALKYLRDLKPDKTYVVALCNLVFAETRQAEYLPRIQTNANWLIDNALGWKATGKIEGWSYPQNKQADNSNTQYALLGLYAAKQAGATIPNEVWAAILDYYKRHQTDSGITGYWTYYNEKGAGSISMTVAGVCGLLIASMGLDISEQGLDPATGVAKNCGLYAMNGPVAKGMNWVAQHFRFESIKSTFYNVYGIERLGRLSGQRFIGSHDWYREGCEFLVGKWDTTQKAWVGGLQDPVDGWIAKSGDNIDGAREIATAFALLFLSKGRTPVLVTKFAWGNYQAVGDGLIEVPPVNGPRPPADGANWNRKHNDTRHIVEFCSKELFDGTPLSWQVYDARRLDFGGGGRKNGKEQILEEVGLLLQSPVLYMNGHGPIVLSPAQEEILKTYIEEGGFLVAEACCGDPVFADSFKKLMKKILPGSPFRQMKGEHIIMRILPGLQPTDFQDVEVMDRGCRTVAVFSPTPLAGFWEEAKYMPKDSRRPQNNGEKAYVLARNIVAYATGMEKPKPKLARTQIEAKRTDDAATRSKFKPLQLELHGVDRPAPDALRNLMAYLRDNARLEVSTTSAVLQPHLPEVAGFKFMYMHGRGTKDANPLDWADSQIDTVKSNLQTGGLLLADAACAGYDQWQAYDKSFRELCAKMFPDNKLEPITERMEDGREDPLFKIAREAGINIRTVRCRHEIASEKKAEPELKEYPVHLEGVKINGRWVIVYSKYDLGCAMEGHKAADCLGHDKDSALRVAAAVTLYSLKR